MRRGTRVLPPFVDADWLEEHLDEVVVADCRWFLDGTDARAAHREAHIPGAVFVDLDRDLAAPPSPQAGRHPLPDPEDFAGALGRLGVGAEDTVVAYDQGPGAIAARLVWMLRVLGQEAAVLDGGLPAWQGPLEDGDVRPDPREVPVRPWPADRLADANEVALLAAGKGSVVDARAPERFRGEREPIDPRAGHVPGAVNLPYEGNLGSDGRLLPPESLRERFTGLTPDIAVYCGSGVTACHDVLVLESLGVDARLYPGSWSAWVGDPDRPVATGP